MSSGLSFRPPSTIFFNAIRTAKSEAEGTSSSAVTVAAPPLLGIDAARSLLIIDGGRAHGRHPRPVAVALSRNSTAAAGDQGYGGTRVTAKARRWKPPRPSLASRPRV